VRVTTPSGPQRDDGQSDGERLGTPTQSVAHKPLPLQLGLPQPIASDDAGQPVLERERRRATLRPRATAAVLGGLAALAAMAAACAVWALPWYVRKQCVDIAAEHGIDLSVDQAKIDSEGFRLIGVQARAAAVPGARAQALEVDVETSGLRPRKLTAHGAELILAGHWRKMDADFANWRANPSGGQSGSWAPESLVIEGARVVWQASAGDNVRVEAADVHAQVAWHERGADLHARSDQVSVTVPGGQLGPWRVDIDRAATGARMRVALDPAVPEACTVLVVADDERITSIDVVVPRSPLAHLGISDRFLALTGQGLQIDTTAHYAAVGATRADASTKGGVHGIVVPGLPRPIDVTWEGTANGDPSIGMDVKKARLAVGPLVGPLTGTIKRFEDGFRLDLAWAAGPAPCSGFVAPLGLGQPFDIDYELRRLASSAVAANIKGNVSATAMVSFDSRDLGATKVDFTPDIRCRGQWVP
jgi:hypothetical protein